MKYHRLFGESLRKANEVGVMGLGVRDIALEYIKTIHTDMMSLGENYRNVFLYTLLIVSISDIYASQPYGVGEILTRTSDTLNVRSKFFPFITNLPKKYRGGNISEVIDLSGKGIVFAKTIMDVYQKYLDTFMDTS